MNFFDNIPADLSQEVFQDIVSKDNVKIERIISHGQSTPSDQPYIQNNHEWVILLKGQAAITFDDDHSEIILNPGDYLFIEKLRPHRVLWTLKDQTTIWLAVHF